MTRLETVPLWLEAQGSVIALDEVDIRPQRTGTVSAIHIKEGDEVKQGQLLFSLDSRDDDANVRRAEAALNVAQVQLNIAEREFKRSMDLSAQSFISTAALDTARNKQESAAASVAQMRAALDQAKVVQSHARIMAPFAGRVGRIDVRVASLVVSNTTTSMTKITRLDPMGISFSLPERELPILQSAQSKGPLAVEVELGGRSLKGQVIFIDTGVDRVSGTIGLKARVKNEARSIVPGQYVTVKIRAGEMDDVVVLPAQAVVNGPDGRFVYRIKDDQSVAPQTVQLQRIVDQKAIVSGIKAGVEVVLEGAANLRPGSKVQVIKASEGGGGGERGSRRRGKKGGGEQGQSGPSAQSEPAASGEERRGKGNRSESADQSGAAAGEGRRRGGQSAPSAGAQP